MYDFFHIFGGATYNFSTSKFIFLFTYIFHTIEQNIVNKQLIVNNYQCSDFDNLYYFNSSDYIQFM